MNEQSDDRMKIIKQYAEGPELLEKALSNLTESQLDLIPSDSGWTIRQIANHIVDGDDIWKVGIKAALGCPDVGFSLEWYWRKPQVEWSDLWAYTSRDLSLALSLCKANRAHIVDLIQRIPDAWKLSIRIQWPHQSEGRISVG